MTSPTGQGAPRGRPAQPRAEHPLMITVSDPAATGELPACRRDERGAGTVLALVIIMLVIVAAGVAACGASWVRCAHQARSTADLAALAGAQALADGGDGCAVARRTVAQNGARLADCEAQTSGDQLLVRVTVTVTAVPHLPGGPDHFQDIATAGRI